MRFHGSKKKYADEISSFIFEMIKILPNKVESYIEPFCGNCHVYNSLSNKLNDEGFSTINFLLSDKNENLIALHKELKKGYIPPTTCSEEYYNNLKKNNSISAEKGYIGFQYSFRGQFFKGYAPKYYGNKEMDSSKQSHEMTLLGKNFFMDDVFIEHADYSIYKDFKNSVFYMDPPYRNTHCYYGKKFDSEKFWNFVRELRINNVVFVSEYSAPDDFLSIWTSSNGKEKLFV